MDDSFKDEVERQLQALPIWASITLAARTARRMEPLFCGRGEVHPGDADKISKAIDLSERMARGEKIDSETGGIIARAAAGAARAASGPAALAGRAVASAGGTAVIAAAFLPEAATNAARAAAFAARDADHASGDDIFRSAVRKDLDLLSEWAGSSAKLSPPISILDAPLWPDGEPEWATADAPD